MSPALGDQQRGSERVTAHGDQEDGGHRPEASGPMPKGVAETCRGTCSREGGLRADSRGTRGRRGPCRKQAGGRGDRDLKDAWEAEARWSGRRLSPALATGDLQSSFGWGGS